jgi:hypothetical protein
VTAIWLTPWYDNPDEANQCDKPWCPNTNYHGYHAIDYYAVENHFGTMADLRDDSKRRTATASKSFRIRWRITSAFSIVGEKSAARKLVQQIRKILLIIRFA